MNLVQSIFRGGLALRADASGTPAPWDDYWYRPVGGQHSASGMRVSPETAKRLATVIACVSYRGKMVGIIPFRPYRDLAGGGKRLQKKHPLYRLLYLRPNPVQTPYEFKHMLNAHVDLRGNAYARIVRKDGDPVELWPLHPDRVTVEVDKDTQRPLYKYANPLSNETETFVQSEIFQLRDWSDGMYLGQSRISMGLDTFGVALARQDYTARWFKNDSRTGLVISGADFASKEDEENFIKSIQRGGTGENRGRPMIVGPGLTVQQLGVTPVDAQLIEGDKASDTKICSIFGVLPHAVGVDAGKAATFASTEQFNIMNAQQCVHPMVTMWEQCIQRDLIDPDDDVYVKGNMATLLRGDNATRYLGYQMALGANGPAWITPDEVRELEDLNPMPDGQGEVAWRPMNLAPLDQLQNPTPPALGKTSAADDSNAEDAPEDGSGGADGSDGSKAQQAPALRAQMALLATGIADRCVRRERSAVSRMIDRHADFGEIARFYAEHAVFVMEAFHFTASAALKVKVACDARGQQLAALLAEEDVDAAHAAGVWIEQVAATEAAKLVQLAVEGV